MFVPPQLFLIVIHTFEVSLGHLSDVFHIIFLCYFPQTDPLERLMREYAMKCGLNHESLTFTFDGDVVRKSQTPESLEMEDDDCLDVAGS